MRAGRRRPAAKASTLVTVALLRRWPLPKPDPTAGKEGRGSVLVVGGSEQIPGAVILAATAALRAGAGKLQIATCRSVAGAVAVAVPEARVIGLGQGPKGELGANACAVLGDEVAGADAVLVGPGMFDGRAGIRLLRDFAPAGGGKGRGKGRGTGAATGAAKGPVMIVDAAALGVFESRRKLGAKNGRGIIATPHAGEMATLWGLSKKQIEENALAIAVEAAAQLGAVVVLKGAQTFIVDPDGTSFHNTAGNNGLGTSGSGDTLSGIVAGLCARGAAPVQAAVWGVFLHARAGEALARKLGPLGFLARELPAEVPAQLARLAP